MISRTLGLSIYKLISIPIRQGILEKTASPQTMASTHQSLLNLSTIKNNGTNTIKICLSISTLLAILICIATVLTIFHPYHVEQEQPQPSDLCIGSPNPSSCRTIVAASIESKGHVQTPSEILMTLVDKSLQLLAKTIIVTGTDTIAATDCMELLDISRDQLHDVGSAIRVGAYTDARTWLSATLTNYDTCLDEFNGLSGSSPRLKAHLGSLSELASASLAMLNALQPNTNDDVEKYISTVFPSWMTGMDKKFLEDSTGSPPTYVNVTVALDGSGDYEKIQDAVDSAPNKGKHRYVIYVKSGTYYENVVLSKKKTNVTIVGDGMNATIISGNRSVKDNITTFNTATLAAVGANFILQDICIENTAGPDNHQAVALRVGSDHSVVNRCQIRAYQDTLYPHSLRQFYRDCLISGTIDFIFGNAAVVLQNCTLISRLPMSKQKNVITAQGRKDPNQNTGTSIQNCRIVPSKDLIPNVSVVPSFLGRPWKEFSRTVYMESYIDSHISPKGWLEWDGDLNLDTLYYGEYNNFGPGAGLGGRVNWTGYHVITDPAVASNFTVRELIQGDLWLKSTGVEFVEGL